MSGRIVAVTGSGAAGRTRMMTAAKAARPDLHLVRRVTTRPDAGGGCEVISPAEFARRRADGGFAIHWQETGHGFAIPATVEAAISEGRTILFAATRDMLGLAWEEFPSLAVVHLLAGQDSSGETAGRSYLIPCGVPLQVVAANRPDAGLAAFLAALNLRHD